jgi:hypothetical protein
MKRSILLMALITAFWCLPNRESSAEVKLKGFTPLFNGKDLTGWTVVNGKPNWGYDQGVLYTSGAGGWLISDRQYGDFELRLEYALPPMGKTALAMRAPLDGDPAYSGIVIPLLDDGAYKPKAHQATGGIFDVLAPSKPVGKAGFGQWNALRVVAKGLKLTVELNGTKVVDTNFAKLKEQFKTHPGLLRGRGHLGLQSDEGRVQFANVVLKPLKK